MSIRNGLLTLLIRQPMYGYQLRQEFEASTGGVWPLNIGQVYTTLSRLERDGLVEVSTEGDEAQRIYTISAAGRAEAEHWLTGPVAHEAPPRSELAIKLAVAVRTPGADIARIIQNQRTATLRALQAHTRAREAIRDDLAAVLVADSLVHAAEAELRWLDQCEERVARAHRPAAQPTPSPEPTMSRQRKATR